ncbi:MAG: hypothetical protein ABI601_15955 [bacterium]
MTGLVGRLALATLLIVAALPLEAQRIAPSGVQHLDIVHDPVTPSDTAATRGRSHVDGAVHGGLVGFAAGAVTGASVFGLAYVASSTTSKAATSGEVALAFWFITGAGAVAGTALGALIGGIVGR